jgi:high-affinity iron transporter
MFLNAVILILQEILEAVLLLSMLLVLTGHLNVVLAGNGCIGRRWALRALLLGAGGALLYGWMLPTVSQWFDYVGVEVVNAALQFGIIACLLLFCFLPLRGPLAGVLQNCMIVVVALCIVREGSEVILYLQGIFGHPENLWPVLLGALMAVGIGLSSGVLLFHSLGSLRESWSFRIALVLLALFAGNMAAQAVQLLTQADWLPYSVQLWDSSAFIAEYSVTGQLLYALVGYEANPSLLQAGAYALAMLLVLLSPLFRTAWHGR